MNNLLGITGGKSMGKDTVAKIINTLHQKQYKTKRFADPLKRFVADILGVSVELLEDRAYKETALGEEWSYFETFSDRRRVYSSRDSIPTVPNTHFTKKYYTPRLLMQLIGTEVGRQVHENIWINALFATYKPIGDNLLEGEVRKVREEDLIYPKWIIPDTRFDNEAQAIKDRGGIIIKVQRDVDTTDTHASEKGVSDKYVDIVIDNNGSMEDLVEEVKTILYAS